MTDDVSDLIGSNAMAGSAIDVQPYPVLSLRWAIAMRSNHGFVGLSDQFRSNQELDTVSAHKYPNLALGYHYIADGTISINPREGMFTFASSTSKPLNGALKLNQKKSTMASTAGTTILGSPVIKSLTGMILNPIKQIIPSSAITPHKTWLQSWFPIFVEFSIVDFTVTAAAQALLFQSIGLLFKKEGDKTTIRKNTKDLGTLIVDNQDFEQRILEERVAT